MVIPAEGRHTVLFHTAFFYMHFVTLFQELAKTIFVERTDFRAHPKLQKSETFFPEAVSVFFRVLPYVLPRIQLDFMVDLKRMAYLSYFLCKV